MRALAAPFISSLFPYIAGKPVEQTEREYGVVDVAKLASNESCLGASPRALRAAQEALQRTHRYPDDGIALKERIAQRHEAENVTPSQIVLGNGTTELILLFARAFLGEGEALLNAWPSFVCYRMSARAAARAEVMVPLHSDLSYDLERMALAARNDPAVKLVFLANPNNPTGRALSAAELDAFVYGLPSDVIVVIDEAYAEYDLAHPDGIPLVQRRPRTVVLRTFSKVFGLAALRMGYAVCDPEIAAVLERVRDPFNTSTVAQSAARAALDDHEHVERCRSHNDRERPRLTAALGERGFGVTPSQANFVLARVSGAQPAAALLHEQLLQRGVIVRPLTPYGLDDALRITVGTTGENDKLLGALDDILSTHR